MIIRLETIRKTMDKKLNESFSEEYCDIRLESDAIYAGMIYLNNEIRRTVIMLKICLYKQKFNINISIEEENSFVEENESEGKSTSGNNYETNLKMRQTLDCNTEEKFTHEDVIQDVGNFGKKILTENFKKFRLRRKWLEEMDFFGNNAEFEGSLKETNNILVFFHTLEELRKINCKFKFIFTLHFLF